MFFRKFFWLFATLLLFGGLFTVVRGSQYQQGYTQGFIAGQLAAGEEGATAVAPPMSPAPSHGFSFFSMLFKFFAFFFGFMLLMGFMGMLFGGRHWKHHKKHWRTWDKHGRKPKWHFDDDEYHDEPIMKA